MTTAGDTPHEASLVIGRMVDLVREIDPLFFEKVGCDELLDRRTCPRRRSRAPRGDGDAFAREFDARLEGRGLEAARQLASTRRASIADAVRATFGLTCDEMPDEEAIDRVLNPARNRYRLDVMNVSYHSPMMRGAAPRVVHVREAPQPHGRLAGPAPPHGAGVAAADDVCRHGRARLRRRRGSSPATRGRWPCTSGRCSDAWAAKNRLLALGVPLEFALYVLPNAKALRMVESGALIALLHKWTLRTCFNAQEEIYLASMDEVAQVRETHPQLARTSARRAWCATASSRRAAPKAPTSAASPCGAASRTSSGASKPMRHAGLRASGSRLRALQEHAPVACPRARVTSAEAAPDDVDVGGSGKGAQPVAGTPQSISSGQD